MTSGWSDPQFVEVAEASDDSPVALRTLPPAVPEYARESRRFRPRLGVDDVAAPIARFPFDSPMLEARYATSATGLFVAERKSEGARIAAGFPVGLGN
jgi:hypothetical protein